MSVDPPRIRLPFFARGKSSDVMVIGLGRFGATLATELEAQGSRVLGVDADPETAQRLRDELSEVVIGDTTTEAALREIGAAEYTTVVVAIASIEDSLLTTGALVDLGVPDVWARAVSSAHARILERIGAHHVVQPDRNEARRIAQFVSARRMVDYLDLEDGFAVVEVRAPQGLVGRTIGEANVRSEHRVTIILVKPKGGRFDFADASTVIGDGDLLVAAGRHADTERFAALT